jgi:hypothetical protein
MGPGLLDEDPNVIRERRLTEIIDAENTLYNAAASAMFGLHVLW